MTMVRFLRKLVSADAMGWLLILVALQALTYGLSSSLRNTDTRFFFWICLVAALIALGLSKLKLNGIQASVGMIALGVLGIWTIAARLVYPLLDLGKAILLLTPQLIPTIQSHFPIDTTSLAEPWRIIRLSSYALDLRVHNWFFSLTQNGSSNDGLIRSMIWTLIIWLIAAWMGWFAGRRKAIAALLPSMLLLAIVTAYSERRVYALWVIVCVLLLLMGIWNYKNHTTQWDRKKVDYSDSIRYDVGQSVLFLTITISAIAFFTPSVSWREIRDFLRERNRPSQNEAADILGVRQAPAPVGTKNVPVQKPSLPREHLLSGGYAQSEKIVMTIRTGELPPTTNDTLAVSPPIYYWRSTTYDTYMGAGWVTSSAPPQKFQANTPLIPGLLKGYRTLHLDVTLAEPEGKLFWSGILFSVDVPFTADWRVRPQSNLFLDQSALLEADMFIARSNTNAYQAESYVPLVTITKMREASSEYPQDIRERYLQLPQSLPERVRQLAKELTDGKVNAYEKAIAIESYLRTYPYDLNVSAPPENQDVADYFLFDLKKGYCDYYATAMVVLARASGLPARFVSGYSSGSYDAPNAQYVVRELNAHSWAEIYFPEIGWIEFEPTASQPEIDRPLSDEPAAADQNSDSTARELLNRFRLEKAIYLLSPIAGIFVLLLFYLAVIESWVYLRLAPELAIEKIYRGLYRLGRPLAGKRTRAETAYEFKQKLINRIEAVSKHSVFPKLLFSAQNDIEVLTQLYQATLFSHTHVQKNDAKKALKVWKHLRTRLLMTRINVIASMKSEAISQFIKGLLRRTPSAQAAILSEASPWDGGRDDIRS
jgi:transglutaminase-like putative cysteine protease